MSFAYFIFEANLLPLTLFVFGAWGLPIFTVIFWEKFLIFLPEEFQRPNHYIDLDEKPGLEESVVSGPLWAHSILIFLFVVETAFLVPIATSVFLIPASTFFGMMATLAVLAEGMLYVCDSRWSHGKVIM